ncbi:SWIM zinc finger family protein [Dactylosporangium aurantiacum]|uniref:SWIM zinc finger family protein n=1 Tax=Dactylosporangium aurantiacum TaxID=35754 RepID=A0A9Q9IKR7_9ACTN|nr:SWIM zinc finger family protein [Dactylosporangium aurantiacum]MDG6104354.1 SWIM zinc finger family protein [Dactylosporangium aurantiacum]UWZ56658.1 SWIM zinc finger family protein [Dactylosporangium aurantiacum]
MTTPEYWGSRTVKVEGGIRARSARGAIGESWWSKRFLGVLESFALGTRLTRGRNYARAGQVLSLSVDPGVVSAVVQGSRPAPYQVSIALQVFDDDVWQRVETALAAEALGAAKLLAGELPPHVEDVFAAADAPLFPARVRDLLMRCSCPDAAVPCKHLAATFYLLAERFDADPFQILLWRGRTRDTLLANLRALRTGTAATAPAAAAPVLTGAARALADMAEPDVELERFWYPPVPLADPEPAAVAGRDLLLRQLPTPPPALGGRDLLTALRGWYR